MGNFFGITIEMGWAAKTPFMKQSHKCSLGLKFLLKILNSGSATCLKYAYSRVYFISQEISDFYP